MQLVDTMQRATTTSTTTYFNLRLAREPWTKLDACSDALFDLRKKNGKKSLMSFSDLFLCYFLNHESLVNVRGEFCSILILIFFKPNCS